MTQNQQNTWLETTLGQRLMSQEQRLFDAVTGDIFGFNAVQLGLLQIDTLKNSRIPNIIRTGNYAGDCYCESDYLPFAPDCIDLLCLPHVLEFSENPHETLREAERVLVPEGYLIITGFNPVSTWGIKHAFNKEENYPWKGHFFTISRIKDWLALLGLEFVSGDMGVYEPPINNEKWLNRCVFMDKFGSRWWPMLGGVYFIVARKRVVNMTLLKPGWQKTALRPRFVVSAQKQSQKTKSQ